MLCIYTSSRFTYQKLNVKLKKVKSIDAEGVSKGPYVLNWKKVFETKTNFSKISVTRKGWCFCWRLFISAASKMI